VEALWTAIRLLTCFPTPPLRRPAAPALVGSLQWFPLVGAALGAALGVAELGVRKATGSHPLACAVVVAAGLLVTRGVHLRGLMALAGALFSGRTREETAAAAARDQATAFGLLLGMAALLLRYAVILALPGELRPPALLLAGGLSRGAIVWVCWRFPYAELDTGIGGYFGVLAGPRDLVWALPLLALGFGTLGPLAAPAGLLGAWALPHLFAWWVARQLGGATARVYEATAEVSELAALSAIAGLAQIGRFY
jgi:adenosylcobinamide-GDP ribazoletransferase